MSMIMYEANGMPAIVKDKFISQVYFDYFEKKILLLIQVNNDTIKLAEFTDKNKAKKTFNDLIAYIEQSTFGKILYIHSNGETSFETTANY